MEAALKHIGREELEKQLEQALATIKEKEQELDRFVYLISHDLKQPINAINALASLIENQPTDEITSDTRECLSLISQSSVNLKQQLDGLLKLSRIGRELNYENVDLNELVQDLIDEMQVGEFVQFEKLPTVWGLKKELRELFEELLVNALKFKNEGVTSEVYIGVSQGLDDYEFFISDNGIGIEDKHSDKIFDVFTRLHAYGDYEGVGIGLAVCKKVMHFHGGNIWLKESSNLGSKFSFTIKKQ